MKELINYGGGAAGAAGGAAGGVFNPLKKHVSRGHLFRFLKNMSQGDMFFTILKNMSVGDICFMYPRAVLFHNLPFATPELRLTLWLTREPGWYQAQIGWHQAQIISGGGPCQAQSDVSYDPDPGRLSTSQPTKPRLRLSGPETANAID